MEKEEEESFTLNRDKIVRSKKKRKLNNNDIASVTSSECSIASVTSSECSITSLTTSECPSEMWYHIFTFLGRKDLHTLYLTCKQWYSLATIVVQSMYPIHTWKTTSKLSFLTTIGKTGRLDGEFTYPSGIAIEYSNDNKKEDILYICDTHLNRIQKFNNKTREWIQTIKCKSAPSEIAIDNSLDQKQQEQQGYIYVSSMNAGNITVMNEQGQVTRTIGTEGSIYDQLNEPGQILIVSTKEEPGEKKRNTRSKKYSSI